MERPLQVLHLEDDILDVELIEETLKAENAPCVITPRGQPRRVCPGSGAD